MEKWKQKKMKKEKTNENQILSEIISSNNNNNSNNIHDCRQLLDVFENLNQWEGWFLKEYLLLVLQNNLFLKKDG